MRIFSVLIIAVGFLLAQTPSPVTPKDVDGWGKIKWGMTINEARAIYNIEAPPTSSPTWTTITLDPVTISNLRMTVSVSAPHGSDKVTQVDLFGTFGLPSDPPMAGSLDFDAIKTLMIQKYGPPVNTESKVEFGDAVRTVLWTFPSTTIMLKISQKVPMSNLGTVSLQYKAPDKKMLDII